MAQKMYLETRNMDPQIAPGEDFYQYAVGGWIARNPIPDERSEWSTFHRLRADVEKKLRRVILDAAQKKRLHPHEKMVVDLYKSGMHASRNRKGVAPLMALLQEVDAVTDEEGFARMIARCHMMGVSVFFVPLAEPDEKKTDVTALYIYQGGLTLPERTYYLDRGKDYAKVRRAYREHFACMGAFFPQVATPAFEKSVLRIERFLAQHARTRVAMRDVHKQYNKMTFAALRRAMPQMDWRGYFAACNAPMPRTVIVGQPEYMTAVNESFTTFSLLERKRYLMWRIIVELAPYTSEEVSVAHFAFFGKMLSGAKVIRPRWKRVVQAVDMAVGESLGQMFCAVHFPPRAKKRVEKMTQQMIAVFGERITALPWMADATKKKALKKLATITVKIGYPETPKTYAGLVIDVQDFFGNMCRAHEWHFADMMARVGKPTDRARWEMTAHTVNAYYHPSDNDIVFPAGILQPPFFHDAFDDAMNFGGIGTVIAHEITHGFDDQGSLFDAQGNMKDWWSASDRRKFTTLTKKMIAQFDAFEVAPGLHVQGALTVGENIADLGGLMVAFDALQRTVKDMHRRGPDGMTVAQRFFLSYALTEAGQMRTAEMRRRIVTDPHAPGKFRVNGPLANMDVWYEAFGITPDDAMYRAPRQRIVIW